MSKDLKKLAKELDEIDAFMVQTEHHFINRLKHINPSNRKNAINLLHYLALRSLDIRKLQEDLHASGLSSMASSESHIRGQLLSISRLLGKKNIIPSDVFTYETGKKSLFKKTKDLFGTKDIDHIPFIMVTFESSLASDYEKVKNLLQSGMNVARINCAHDDESTWFSMIQQIKKASKITGLSCKIYMDLAGPKIRTIIKGRDRIKIKEGQTIYLTDEQNIDSGKNTLGCTIPGISGQLNPGETVLIDDGLIEAIVEKTDRKKAMLRILRISSKKPFIKQEKGINFPHSILTTPALTEYDKNCLPFILKNADIVGYSFVNSSRDIQILQKEIEKNKKIALVLKIETPEAVKNLPDLILSAMHFRNIGVMIARGDLAVEIGFERMSEIQEEILWICEAAHVPVIWATQVLENLNKTGIATRSEITDASHAAMAECVMINKGMYTIHTLETLKDVMNRSGGHHVKKRYTFRPLGIASGFLSKKNHSADNIISS